MNHPGPVPFELGRGRHIIEDPHVSVGPAHGSRRIHPRMHAGRHGGTTIADLYHVQGPEHRARMVPMPVRQEHGIHGADIEPQAVHVARTQALWPIHFTCFMRRGHPLARGPFTLDRFLNAGKEYVADVPGSTEKATVFHLPQEMPA